MSVMRISVIIPTYRRVKDLERCLKGVLAQSRAADELLIVIRKDDSETAKYIKNAAVPDTLKIVYIEEEGQVAAMNAGIEKATGDVLVFLDDDAVPSEDWLAGIIRHYERDPGLGGLGGRDRLVLSGRVDESRADVVGKVTWYGRIVGNHHAGYGGPRPADHLKGANMSFRNKALGNIRCDTRLRGKGAQYRNDLALCLAIRNKGWKLVYDPAVLVDHYYAARFDEDIRGEFDKTACRDLAFNSMVVIRDYMRGYKKISCFLYSILVSDIATPGLLQLVRMISIGKGNYPWLRFKEGMRGRFDALFFNKN